MRKSQRIEISTLLPKSTALICGTVGEDSSLVLRIVIVQRLVGGDLEDLAPDFAQT